MSKIKIKIESKLINEQKEYITNAIKDKNIIKYYEENNLIIIDFKYKILKKINKNEEIIFDFLNYFCFIKDKNNKYSLKIPIKVYNILCDTSFFVKYKINDNICNLKITILK